VAHRWTGDALRWLSLSHAERVLLFALDREATRDATRAVQQQRGVSLEQYVATKAARGR
tara:strand:+ start:1004 stop:1180 length:177 start_codon:yes stop_codon:yes gene_type:complete